MAIKRQSKVDASFSPSSMTDMIFLLLTFFVVLTTMITPNAIKVLLPQSNGQVKEKPAVAVTVDRNLNYFIEGDQVPFAQFESRLRERLAGEQEPVIALHIDEAVPSGKLIEVHNIATRNDIRIIIRTRPES